MAIVITIQNRQRTKRVNVAELRRITIALFGKHLQLELGRTSLKSSKRRGNETLTKNKSETPQVVSYADRRFMGELGITLVGDKEMTRINEHFLQHEGSTDVITFDHAEPGTRNSKLETVDIHGELFICVDEAARQAKRFKTTWQSEIVRYVVHGVLHLLGHDDKRAAPRKRMKREEDRLVAELAHGFKLSQLARQ